VQTRLAKLFAGSNSVPAGRILSLPLLLLKAQGPVPLLFLEWVLHRKNKRAKTIL